MWKCYDDTIAVRDREAKICKRKKVKDWMTEKPGDSKKFHSRKGYVPTNCTEIEPWGQRKVCFGRVKMAFYGSYFAYAAICSIDLHENGRDGHWTLGWVRKNQICKNYSSTSIFWIRGIYKALESWFQLDLKAPSLPKVNTYLVWNAWILWSLVYDRESLGQGSDL